jgi:biotin operon repressor
MDKTDLNQQIRKLKGEGMSLRRIAAALGVTHVAILKRWRAIREGKKVVTNGRGQALPKLTKEERNPSAQSNPHTSRLCEDSDQGGNQVVTQNTPTSDTGENLNSPARLLRGPERGKKKASQRGYSGSGDLLSTIQEFLEAKGIEMYRMNVEPEAYQVKRDGQTIRFYVQREQR